MQRKFRCSHAVVQILRCRGGADIDVQRCSGADERFRGVVQLDSGAGGAEVQVQRHRGTGA